MGRDMALNMTTTLGITDCAASPDMAHSVCPNCGVLAWCLPADLDPRQTRWLGSLTEHRRRLKRGAFLHHAGAKLTSLYAIRSGSVKTRLTCEDGREQIAGFSFPQELIGVEAINGARHPCDVVALEDTTVCGMSFGTFELLNRDIPALQHHFNAAMSREITGYQHHMLLLGCMRAEERVALFLLNLSGRFAARGYSVTKFLLPMSRADIANYLGLQSETVSRVFSSLCRCRLLEVDGKLMEIRDLKGLQKVTGDRVISRLAAESALAEIAHAEYMPAPN